MDGATASSLPLLLVNLVCAAVALGIGFVAGGWFLGARETTPADPGRSTDADEALEQLMAAERSAFASSRLKDLARGMATDVGEHSSQVEKITADLEAAKTSPEAQKEAEVSAALEKIVAANEQLQQKLVKAEQQIQAQAEEIRAHESEARTDSLTKIANRRAFDDHLQQRFAEWTRKATPFSLIILDVDHFKQFNDTHGHQAGDEVLRQVAQKLEQTVREMDIACRYGGEEFALILPATIARDATGLAERIRKGIESLQITFEGKKLSVTASLGLAQVNSEDDGNRLLKRADEALYSAKDAGRNCGYYHEGQLCVPLVGDAEAAPATTPSPAAEDRVPTNNLDKLPNRTLFAEELRRRIAESERTGEPISVVAIEVTAFKAVCQEYGD
ncbi:MAG: diguanylate cyclase, partial [Planctomycetota bacterium]